MGAVLFNIFIHDPDTEIKSTLSKFADDTKLNGVVDTTEERNSIQSDLNKLENCVYKNIMNFNKSKYKVLPMGQGNPRCEYKLGELIEIRPEE